MKISRKKAHPMWKILLAITVPSFIEISQKLQEEIDFKTWKACFRENAFKDKLPLNTWKNDSKLSRIAKKCLDTLKLIILEQFYVYLANIYPLTISKYY